MSGVHWKCSGGGDGAGVDPAWEKEEEAGRLRGNPVHAQPGHPNHNKCCGAVLLSQEPDFQEQRP